MENFLKGLKSLGAKAKDLVTLTDKEKKEGKKANVAEKVTSTVGDWFAPNAKKNADGTFTPEVRVRDFARELPGAVGDVGKEVLKGFARFGVSAGESIAGVPLGINELINPSTKYKVPIYEPEKIPGLGFLGPIESYQNQLKRELAEGKNAGVSTAKAVGNIALDEPLGVALKPLGLAMGAFVKSGGGKAVQETIENIAKSVDPGEIKTFLKNLGIGKKAIDDLAEPLVNAKTAEEVMGVLGYTDKAAKASVPKNPIKKAEAYGFEGFVEDMGGTQEAKDWAKQYWAKPGKEGTYYHVTESADPFSVFDKSKAVNYDPVNRNGGISMINGLYVGKDKNALKNFYGMDKDVKVLTFKGEPKLLDLTSRDTEEKFIADVMKKYKVTDRTSAELGDAMEKEIAAQGYDGAKYFDPYATGDEIVITNPKVFAKEAGEAVSRETKPVTDIKDANKYKSSEEFVKAKNAYKDGLSDGTMEPHAYLPLKEVYPGEYDTWKEVIDLKDNVYTSGKVKDNSKAILVRKYLNSDGFAIEDGHHRAANFIKENAIKDPDTSEIKIPVYFDADTLDKIWKIQNEVKPNAKMAETYDILARELGRMDKGAVTATPGEDTMKSIGDIMKGRGNDIVPPAKPVAEARTPKGDPERRFVTRAREMAPQMDQYLEGKYSRRSTQELADNAEKLIKENETAAENLARTGTDDQAVAVASRLIDDLVTKARSAKGVEKDALYEKAAQIANDAARNLTEAGRAVQAASLLGRMTPEGMVRYAARQIQKYNEKAGERTVRNFLGMAKKVPELTADQAKRITDEMTRINAITDPMQKAREMQMFENEVKSLIPSSVYDKVIAFWKAGLLTGLKTTGVNVGSNIAHTVSEIAKDVPAAMVDKVVSLFTGKRTLSATTKGAYKGTAEGVAKGWDYFKTGFDERNIGSKLDYSKVNFGKGPVAKASQKYVDTVFGMLGAQDQPFYYGAKARSLYSQAIAAAKNEGLKGKAAKEFVEKLVANPTDDMLKYAHLDAETAVFQQDSWLASKAKSLQKGLEIILPFAKTPANVANAMINYSPVGIVKTIIENIGKGRFDQRLFAQGMGRGITGTGALAIGGALMANKMMNLGFPTSEKERQQWELEGRIPNSIKIGDKWRNVGILGPLGMVLIVGGHVKQGLDETGSLFGGLAQAAGGFGNALTEQSFLSGVNRAIDALKDPSRSFEGFASSLAGSVIPTIVADAARATDEYERRTDGPMERLQSRVPGLRRGLEPQVDALGNVRETPNLFEVMADPTRPGNPSAGNDPVTIELRRLLDAGYNSTPTELGDRNGYESLTPEQNTKMWRLAGQYARKDIEDIMKGNSYVKYDDEQKGKLIDKKIQEGKDQARARIVLEAVGGLPESEKKSKLAEMKEDGLLTKTVYQIYLSLSRKK